MKTLSVLALCALLAGAHLVSSDDSGKKLTERVKAVRQMYAKVPPLILGISEPAAIVTGAAYYDGGTVVLEFKDAKNRTFVFHLDRKIGSPTRETLFVTVDQQPRKAVVVRGAEEAALYGILLRWQAPGGLDQKIAIAVDTMLTNLDTRFAAEAAVKQDK